MGVIDTFILVLVFFAAPTYEVEVINRRFISAEACARYAQERGIQADAWDCVHLKTPIPERKA